VKDRVVQAAMKSVIEPIFEREFLSTSHDFRPGRGCKGALREVDQCLKAGYQWVVDADIQSYFDSIPHQPLMRRVEERISDGRVLGHIEGFLKQEILAETKSWTPTRGAPQGAVLSPLLANLYRHPLDQRMREEGQQMIRYADDFVILCRTQAQAEQALQTVREWMERNGLVLHPDKTHVGNCLEKGQGFEFLGYRFEAGRRWVRRKSMNKLKDAIRQRTRRLPGKLLERIIAECQTAPKTFHPSASNFFHFISQA
jgi:RNA-directed DNA polymerase